jgi:hypothetical protein
MALCRCASSGSKFFSHAPYEIVERVGSSTGRSMAVEITLGTRREILAKKFRGCSDFA